MTMRSVGPGVGTLPSSFEDRYKYGNFEQIRFILRDYSKEERKQNRNLCTLAQIPDPRKITISDPDLLPLVQNSPRQEPTIAFPEFVRGVAACAGMIDRRFFHSIQQVLDQISASIDTNTKLPPIDSEFAEDLSEIERAIFENGEPMSWRALIAFTRGVFFLMTFVENPKKKKGKWSAASYAKALCLHAAQNAYLPVG